MTPRLLLKTIAATVCISILLAACKSPAATATPTRPAGTPAATATATRTTTTPTTTSPTATSRAATPTAGASPTAPSPTVAATATATPAAQPTSPPATNTGSVEVRVTDKPPADVTKILITASKIEAQRSGSEAEAGWSTLVETPPPFDLVAVAGLEQVLGSSKLPLGSYTQVRLAITKATVTQAGKDVEATVPSDKLRVVGGFKVEAGKTTVLTLDFDAEKSLVVAGPNIQLKPTAKLLVREPAEKPEPPSPSTLVVSMLEQNASGQTGVATLTKKGNQTEVVINVPSGAAGVAQPSHVHAGSCAQLGAVKYPLANVAGGKSATTIDVPLGALRTGGFVINIHKSAQEISAYTSCGEIPAPEGALTIELSQLGASGQSGWATLVAQGEKTQVSLSVAGGTAGVAQPAHIHEGTCEKLGAVKYPLASVTDGRSNTIVAVALQALRTGAFAVNTHKSAQEINVNTACGNIPTAPAGG